MVRKTQPLRQLRNWPPPLAFPLTSCLNNYMNPEKYKPEPNIPKIEQAETPQEISAEQKANYEIDQVEHDLVSRYQPKFLAKGGEHIVYEVPEHPDIVVKVSTGPLKKVID